MARQGGRELLTVVGHRALVLLRSPLFAAFPFYWMFVTTFKQNSDLYVGATNTAHNPFIFNAPPTLEHLQILFERTLYPTWLVNTLFVGVVVVAITLALTVPAGYSLARLTGRWGERLSIGIFLTYLVPSTLLFIPFSRLVVGPGPSEQPVVPCPRLSDVHGPLLHVASHGILQVAVRRKSRNRPWWTAAAGWERSVGWCCRSRCPVF